MLKIFNSLGRELQEFEPIEDKKVRMYTCGPTVYDYPTIGNWRTYTLSDIINRTLRYLGYEVSFVMNLTDVGHLTGDNVGDADTGEDRLEKAAKKEQKTAWDIAEFYSKDFIEGFNKMNMVAPLIFSKATDHIQEQIDLVKKIEEKGFAYRISDGIYFDTKAYEEAGNKYGELSNLDEIKEGARVEANPEKRDPRDFALWKFSPTDAKRDMEWDSPWGIGFPGWHIECSAMSMKYLGNTIDIHIGGEDLKSTHHPNEIAQSEAATGEKPFSKYWIHGAFLLVDGGRMGKSLGNAYTLQDIEAKGFDLIHLRYFYLTGHYRKQINFTWESLEASRNACEKLVNHLRIWLQESRELSSMDEALETKIKNFKSDLSDFRINNYYKERFIEALEDDFNMPQALAVVWDLVKADLQPDDKIRTILDFDRVLGLKLEDRLFDPVEGKEIPDEAKALIEERNKAREMKDWETADRIRDELRERFGIDVIDRK